MNETTELRAEIVPKLELEEEIWGKMWEKNRDKTDLTRWHLDAENEAKTKTETMPQSLFAPPFPLKTGRFTGK